jgi:KAP family P-loop domain
MSEPVRSEAYSPAPIDSSRKGRIYLSSKTKIWLVGICLALMIAASLYAVFQPLNPDLRNIERLTWLWYPIESNPTARVPAIHCAIEYACRLNSAAVVGTADPPEAWVVGNVGLVLHRSSGQWKWEQQREITVTEESAPSDISKPKPRKPTQATPSPAESKSTTQMVPVPYLMGLSLDVAQTTARESGFAVQVDFESSGLNPVAQQGPPADMKVIRQDPSPKTLAPPNTVIKVVLGGSAKSAAYLLDQLVPSVYAAEARVERPKKPPAVSLSQPTAHGSSTSSNSAPTRVRNSFRLDDDLIHVNCSRDPCRVLGRSGRVYKIGKDAWTFQQASFVDSNNTLLIAILLLYRTSSGSIVAKAQNTIYICSANTNVEWDASKPFRCSEAQGNVLTRNNEVALLADQLQSGEPMIFAKQAIPGNNRGELLLGESGFIAFLSNGSGTDRVTIKPASSGTSAALRSFAFASSTNGIVVGDKGVILDTTDGGETWNHDTQGPEGAIPNHRLPAGWYWIGAVLLILTCSIAVVVPSPPPLAEASVADWTVTDAPLKPGDLDSLDFTPMALGLSRFIRNPKTQPPVTIAIEGEWGEGKTSVMSLLRADLEKSRFRPVWFNAWHHQSEERLLAALLEHIKSQGVPPWYYIDNWIFRVRLLRIRFRKKWPFIVILALCFAASVAYEISHHSVKLEHVVGFGQAFVDLLGSLLHWPIKVPDLGHFGLVATIFAIVATVFQKARAFGIDPVKLTDNLRKASSIKDVKPDPGIRQQFSREFGDLCTAWSWGGRRVIIFIDDLDRCRPETVVTVLESINFLTSAGNCIVVLGMAQEQVTHCVGLGFKDIAETQDAYRGAVGTEQQKAIARFKYGSLYIKKLVNILAPLPKTSEEQRRRILEVKAAAARRRDGELHEANAWRISVWESLSGLGRISLKIVPVLALFLAVFLSVVVGYRQGQSLETSEPHVSPGSNPEKQAVGAPLATRQVNGTTAKPLTYERPTSEAATLADAITHAVEMWWSYGLDTLFFMILICILAYELGSRTNQDAQNSADFEDSLRLWGNYIVSVCETPREIKRALNDLRYQAMTRRKSGPSTTRGERITRVIRQFITGSQETAATAIRVDEAALPPRKAAELASLSDDELGYFLEPDALDIQGSENLKLLMELKNEHVKRFGRWINEKKVESPETDSNKNLGARAAHQ